MSSHDDMLALVGDYKKGSIVRIELRNFLTYGHAVVVPGPRLNMVIGPNGTGKSSILNAICLGLGGSPNVLGRADDVRAFIQNGKDKASIEITLAPGEHTIRREMDRHRGSAGGRGKGASTFYINDEKVSEADVKNLVAQTYHIQVGNLCTFLPQDKVGSFSGLKPTEYLIALEKTLHADVYKTHQLLIESEEGLKTSNTDLGTLQSKLNALQQEQERLEVEKERMRDRQEALQMIEILKKKRVWLEVEHLREQAKELKNLKVEVKKQLVENGQRLQPFEEELAEVQAQVQKHDQKHRQATQRSTALRQELSKQREKYEAFDEAIEQEILEWNSKATQEADLQNQRQKAEEKLVEYKSELEHSPSVESMTETLEKAQQELNQYRKELHAARREEQAISSSFREAETEAQRRQQNLARLQNESQQRKERIFRQFPDLGKIDRWLQDNSGLFRKPVIGPIACHINTASPHAAAILEQHVPNRVLKAFVVRTKGDYDLLYEKVRTDLGLPINVLYLDKEKPITRPYSEDKMRILKRDHGVDGYLDELLDCPDSIRQVLMGQAQIQKVLVGSNKTQESIDRRNLLDFLSEPEGGGEKKGSVIVSVQGGQTMKYTTIISRYSKQPATRQDVIREARLLVMGSDPTLKERAEAELQKAHDEMARIRPQHQLVIERKEAAEVKAQDANNQVEATKRRLDAVQKMRKRLEQLETKIRQLEKQAREIKDTRQTKNVAEGLMKKMTASLQALELHAEKQKEITELKVVELQANLAKSGIVAKERNLRSQIEDLQREIDAMRKNAAEVQEQFARAKNSLIRKKADAEKIAPIIDEDGNPLPLKEELESLEVETLHELEAAYDEAEAKVTSIHDNPEALQKYEEQKQKIEELSEKLNDAKAGKSDRMNKITTYRKGWESTLEKTVAKINTLFSNYMAEMDCAGEVCLQKGEEGQGENEGLANFEDWGIEIRVSFRAGSKLQVLDSMKQSGGERSVSTIMYLMAMQDLMVAPFRCVDEINQGLDERNERLVFKRIVQNSTKPPHPTPLDHAGQYFLITPKLLPNLTDMEVEGITVCFVWNGPFNFSTPTEWNVENMIAAAQSSRKRFCESDDEENSGNSVRSRLTKKKARS